RLAGILLKMQALDPDLDLFRRRHIDGDAPLADYRALVLRDLVALRQIGIEIILAFEDASQVNLGLKAKPGSHGLRDAFLADDRQHPGYCGIDERHIAVWILAKLR